MRLLELYNKFVSDMRDVVTGLTDDEIDERLPKIRVDLEMISLLAMDVPATTEQEPILWLCSRTDDHQYDYEFINYVVVAPTADVALYVTPESFGLHRQLARDIRDGRDPLKNIIGFRESAGLLTPEHQRTYLSYPNIDQPTWVAERLGVYEGPLPMLSVICADFYVELFHG